MKENEERALRRLDIETTLPAGFEKLSEEEQLAVHQRLIDQDIALREELLRKAGKSQIAEHDLAVGIDAVQKLDHERKVYSQHIKGETGSGTYDLKIRGGDTRFIVPILVVIGTLILGVIIVLALL